jgi:hypothetical protein
MSTHDFPLLPLDLWRQEIGYNPWHFWGMANTTIPLASKGAGLVYEYAWQNADACGRDDIRKAIINAENIFLDNVHYWPAPEYREDVLPWPRLSNQRQMRTGRIDIRYGWMPVTLKEGMIRNVGVETLTAIQLAAPVTFYDHDGDGIKEDFDLTVATSVTDIEEIAVYFATADRPFEDNGLSARWRVEPLTVTISLGSAHIKGKRWLVAKPSLYEEKSNYPIDPLDDTKFVTTLDVYRRWTNRDGVTAADSQASIIWESRPAYLNAPTITGSSDPSSIGIVAARVGVRDSENGIITPAEALYDAATGNWYHVDQLINEPDRIQIRYLAGLELDDKGWMQRAMRTLIARLAAAESPRQTAGAEVSNRSLAYWQFDVSRVNNTEEYQISPESLNNPLGTRRGHIYAWQQMIGLARTVGHLA